MSSVISNMNAGLPKKYAQQGSSFKGRISRDIFFFTEGFEQHKLFETKPSFEQFLVAFELAVTVSVVVVGQYGLWLSRLCLRFGYFRRFYFSFSFSRIEQHGRTHTVCTSFAHQDFIIHTTLASFPKLLIVSKF